MTIVAGPLCALVVAFGLALAVFGVGAGRLWTMPQLVPRAITAYFMLAGLGAMVGAVVGSIGDLISRLVPAKPGPVDVTSTSGTVGVTSDDDTDMSIAVPRRRSFLRWFGPAVVGLMLLCVLIMVAGGVYVARAVDRRLADAIAAADRDDPFWRIDDLMAHREAVPDEENSAIVVAEVVAMLPDGWPGKAAAPAGPAPHTGPPPIAQAIDAMNATADNRRIDETVAATVRAELDRYEEALRMARTVANLARGRHELELGPTLIDTRLDETQNARTAVRLLQADAAMRAQDGDIDGALDSCRAILGAGRSIGDEPTLISQLVRFAISGVGVKSVRRLLAQGEPSDDSLAKLASALDQELAAPTLLYGMRGERAMHTEIIRRLRDGEMPISALSGDNSWNGSQIPGGVDTPWTKLWFDNQRAISLEWYNEAVAICRAPVAQNPARWQRLERTIQQTLRSRFGKFIATLPLLLSPAFTAAAEAHLRTHCALAATAILVAAERHRRKTGGWPADVGSIDRALLAKPPIDPYSGEPFRMAHQGGEIVVYSIGPNRKDEGGAFNPKTYRGGGPDDFGTSGWDVALRRQPALKFGKVAK